MKAPLPDYRMHIHALSVRELARMARDGDLDLNPPYQRGDVWTTEQRQNLLKSLLIGIPVAAIVLNRRGANSLWEEAEGREDSYYAVIDGKQRITTGVMWFCGDLRIPSSWLRPEFLPADAPELISYRQLTGPGQRFMGLNFTMPVAEGQLPNLAMEAEVYGLVNLAGTPQTAEDLARAQRVSSS
jgi:hypothetical protein